MSRLSQEMIIATEIKFGFVKEGTFAGKGNIGIDPLSVPLAIVRFSIT